MSKLFSFMYVRNMYFYYFHINRFYSIGYSVTIMCKSSWIYNNTIEFIICFM